MALPEAKVFDNYILYDGLKCDCQNNILNPIGIEDMPKYFTGIEEEELKAAEKTGIYEHAEEQAKEIIRNSLSTFSGYQVVFE